ncbi:hypothetical protein A9179_15300 [Pseudomonas alcaligenes]|uniref:DUF2790 domain-containing protein n=1 Tax=Aquipseudomonas alcaligenes TaxID=43263 RepID=A0ABR7S5G2_AQUAC|nr:DUF2790 domain-containing protein [Pseudomonas alcaligenes]MBC9251638.1 hypothetical protein [Pseudomonas alcaligenes]
MKSFALLILAGLSSCAFAAASGDETVASDTPTEHYHYGMQLDVARVLARSDVSNECGVVPVVMTYEDHQGQVHNLEYLVLGGGCSEN